MTYDQAVSLLALLGLEIYAQDARQIELREALETIWRQQSDACPAKPSMWTKRLWKSLARLLIVQRSRIGLSRLPRYRKRWQSALTRSIDGGSRSTEKGPIRPTPNLETRCNHL